MRKPAFCKCENKGANQLSCNCAADQCLCLVQSLHFLNPKFKASKFYCGCAERFVSDLVGNPEDRFSHFRAHIFFVVLSFRPVHAFLCIYVMYYILT